MRFVEPIQGEGGVVPASLEFMTRLRQRCDEVGALLVVDEVQCGLGRSGKLFAHEITHLRPDLMTCLEAIEVAFCLVKMSSQRDLFEKCF